MRKLVKVALALSLLSAALSVPSAAASCHTRCIEVGSEGLICCQVCCILPDGSQSCTAPCD